MHRLRGREVGRGSSTLSCPLKYGGTVASPWPTDKGGRDFLHIASALHKCMLFMQRRFVDLTFFLSFAVFLSSFLFSLYRYYHFIFALQTFSSRMSFFRAERNSFMEISGTLRLSVRNRWKKEIVETVDEFSSCNANFSNKWNIYTRYVNYTGKTYIYRSSLTSGTEISNFPLFPPHRSRLFKLCVDAHRVNDHLPKFALTIENVCLIISSSRSNAIDYENEIERNRSS